MTRMHKDRPNTLAVGLLFMLMALGAMADAVEGLATIIFLVAALPLFGFLVLVTIGWGEMPRLRRPTPVKRLAPPVATQRVVAQGREWRVVRKTLPRGRVVQGPIRVRASPTI